MTMAMDIVYRTFTPDLEVRSGGDGRTIHGIAVPYNQPVRINERLIESFAPGAFTHQLRAANRVRFAREHLPLGGTLIGAARVLREDAAGLFGEFRVSKTPAGDETLELVKDGALSHLSIGFLEDKDRRVFGSRAAQMQQQFDAPNAVVVERTRAHLQEVAVTLQGAYGELAAVGGVRSNGQDNAPECTPRLEEAWQVLQDLPVLALPQL